MITFDMLKPILESDGHRIGPLTEPNVHGVRSAECLDCKHIIVVHKNGKVDAETTMMKLTCKENQTIRDVAKGYRVERVVRNRR